MTGLVLVSHSRALALAAQELVRAMTGPDLPLAIAAGAGDDHADLGTNAVEIMEAITSVMSDDGVLVLMDMGSALLSTDTALEFLDESDRAKVRCAAAPFVEGAIAAGVIAAAGGKLDEVFHEAQNSLQQKSQHLGETTTTPAAESVPAIQGTAQTACVHVREPHGLHARPAARFVRESAKHDATVTIRNVTRDRGPVSAKSITGIALLEVLDGDEIEISTSGPEAERALHSLVALVEGLRGGEAPVVESVGGVSASPPVSVGVSPGIAIGRIFESQRPKIELPDTPASDIAVEQERLRAAIQTAQVAIKQDAAAVPPAEAEIFEAQNLVLADPALVEAAENLIATEKLNAAAAFHQIYQQLADNYRHLADEYQRQRAADIEDAGLRVLEALGVAAGTVFDLPEPGILLVHDLKPGEVSQIDKTQILGVVMRAGGKTSHAAILLRALGVPAVAGAGGFSVGKNTHAAFDGETGEFWLDPDDATQQKLNDRLARQVAQAKSDEQDRHTPAITRDGKQIVILANLGNSADAITAIDQGAEGVGLFRTEFLFLDRPDAPGEDEQFAVLQSVAQTMGRRPVTIRTLDAGGDKELSWLGLPREDNPFLGVRAIRLCLQRPDIFRTQLRAILRAGVNANFRIMFPMITEPSELVAARGHLTAVHEELSRENVAHAWPISVGIMVEVPSAVILIDQFLSLADFFSIGTNDLTQYVLAADRGNPALAQFQDSVHPAVLRLISQIVAATLPQGKHVCVCGEAAGDPVAAKLLIALGVDELSVTPALVPKIKTAVREIHTAEMELILRKALDETSAHEVRSLLNEEL